MCKNVSMLPSDGIKITTLHFVTSNRRVISSERKKCVQAKKGHLYHLLSNRKKENTINYVILFHLKFRKLSNAELFRVLILCRLVIPDCAGITCHF